MKPAAHFDDRVASLPAARLAGQAASGLLGLVLVLGCAGRLPGIDEALPPLPERWPGESRPSPDEPLAVAVAPTGGPWIAGFGDATLTELVAEALDANPDLQVTRLRLTAALARAHVRAADLWPQIDLSGSGFKQRVSLRDPSPLGGVSGGTGAAGVSEQRFDANYLVAWEIDLFGRARHERSAGIAEAEAARQDLHDAHLALEGEVARAWFDWKAARLQREIDRENLANFEQSAAVVERRYRRGLRTALDLRLARSEEASARAQLTRAEQAARNARRALEVLLGRFPGASAGPAGELPVLPAPVPAGLPAELLQRRPDLRAAAARLDASDHDSRAAFASLFPRIRLTFSGGASSSQLREIVDPETIAWRLAGEITQPIFQGGRLRFDWERQRANAQAALHELASSVLVAFREVEDALDAEVALRSRLGDLEVAADHAVRAASLSRSQYSRGLIDITTLLASQRRALDTRSALLEAHRSALENRVRLHLALGGDFGRSAESEAAESS